MWFARWVFLLAGIYGIVVILPQYLLEARIGRDYPPAITHPEYYYGFVGVGLAWQITFLIISWDPARFRPIMIGGILEKVSFGFAGHFLAHHGLAPAAIGWFAVIDLALGALFAIAYWKVGIETRAG